MPDIDVDVRVASPAWAMHWEGPETVARRAATAACRQCFDGPTSEISILLCDDAAIRDLNRTYRNQDQATDTLSFPADAPVGERPPLGDIVVAFETAAGDAAAQGKSLTDHLAHLVVHGCLHLLGHDHGADRPAAKMEALESKILASLGIADPYGLP